MRNALLATMLGVAALVLVACETPKGGAPPPSQQASADRSNDKICASVVATGSRLAEKECHTAAEWAAIKAEGNDDMQNRAERHMSGQGGN